MCIVAAFLQCHHSGGTGHNFYDHQRPETAAGQLAEIKSGVTTAIMKGDSRNISSTKYGEVLN